MAKFHWCLNWWGLFGVVERAVTAILYNPKTSTLTHGYIPKTPMDTDKRVPESTHRHQHTRSYSFHVKTFSRISVPDFRQARELWEHAGGTMISYQTPGVGYAGGTMIFYQTPGVGTGRWNYDFLPNSTYWFTNRVIPPRKSAGKRG